MALNSRSKTPWWDLASAGTITCSTLSVLSCCVQGEPGWALPVYSDGGAVHVDGVVPGVNASIRVTADRGLVRWQEFSVEAGERFRIEGTPNQAILNVVTGPEASRIGGAIESGPRFLLVNPNGIEVLATGQIVAPSTWLSTGHVRDDDWVRQSRASGAVEFTSPYVQLDRRTAINLAGVIEAEDGGRGGEVTLLAQEIHLAGSAHVVANGPEAGGTIHLGGQAHGQGPTPTASRLSVAAGARLEASATHAGDGGEVVAWSEQQTRFAGQIEALGGPEGGDGGFVEVSGREQLDFQGLVSTMAPRGQAGTLLLDPTNLTISNASDANITPANGVALPSATPSVLSWNTIQSNLSKSSLLIQTTNSPNSGSEKGSITIAAPSPSLSLSNRTLTFQAADDLRIDASISSSATTGSLVFKAGTLGSNNAITIASGQQVKANKVTMTADAIVFNGGANAQVLTPGALAEQRYNGAVTLAGDTLLSGTKIIFAGRIDGAHALQITREQKGSVTFASPVGASNPLMSLAVQSDAILLQGGAVTTTGNQTYSDQLFLGATTTLTSSGPGSLISLSQVDSASGFANADLTVTSSQGDVSVLGLMGAVSRLGDIQVNAGGLTSFGDPTSGLNTSIFARSLTTDQGGTLAFQLQGGVIDTTGSQSYGDLGGVLVSSDLTLHTDGGPSSSVNVAAAMEADPSVPPNLTLDVSGAVNFKGPVGVINPFGTITINNSYGTRFSSRLKAASVLFQPTSILPTDPGSNYLEFLGDLDLQPADPADRPLSFDYQSDSNRLRDLALLGTNNRLLGNTVVLSNTGLLRIGGLEDGQGASVQALSMFEGGLMITGLPQLTTLSGLIQAGLQGEQSLEFFSQVNSGRYELLANQASQNAVTLKAGVVDLNGPIDSAQNQSYTLRLDTSGLGSLGLAVIRSDLGGLQPLQSLQTVNARGRLNFGLGTVTTRQGQSLVEDNVRLIGQSFALKSLDAGLIEFLGVVNGPGTGIPGDLKVITDGVARFDNAIGSSSPLGSFSTAGLSSGVGTTQLNGGQVSTVGDQRYDQSVRLGTDTTLRSGALGTIRFTQAVDGPRALTIEPTGSVAFLGSVGAIDPLTSLQVLAGTATTTLSTGSITTEGLQSYAGAMLLGASTTLASTKAGAITLAGTLNQETATPAGLTIHTAGSTTLSGAIGLSRPIASLSTDTAGTLSLTASTIRTSGAQSYADGVITVGSKTSDLISLESATAGDLRLGLLGSERLEGPGGLQLQSPGLVSIAAVAGGTSPLASLQITARALELHEITTTKAQTYTATEVITTHGTLTTQAAAQPIAFHGPLLLAADTTVITNGGGVTFHGDVDRGPAAAPALHVDTTGPTGGTIDFQARVGAASPLGDVSLVGSGINLIQGLFQALSLVTTSTGSTRLAGQAVVSTTNGQEYQSPVELGGTVTLASTSGGAIAFRDTVTSPAQRFDLTINTSGDTIFDGLVGVDQGWAAHPLGTLTTGAAGRVVFNAGLVRTSGAQSYGNRVVLGADLLLQSDLGGAITLAGPVEALHAATSALDINTDGLTSFGGTVGSLATPLTRLSTDVGGALLLGGAAVITSGDQLYNDHLGVTLGADTLLSATGATPTISLAGPVNAAVAGQQSLTIHTHGLTHFSGAVGAQSALESLITDGSASNADIVEVHGGGVTTTGAQTYGENLWVKASNPDDTRFIATGPIQFKGLVDLDPTGMPGHLTIEAPGASVTFDRDVGSQSPFRTVTVLTGDLNLNNATITANGWDALNPNHVQSVQTKATIAVQGSRSIATTRAGGLQGGTVFNLSSVPGQNSRWLVWSEAPWANTEPTPATSLADLYSVQYLASYNQSMQIAPDSQRNQFLYRVADPSARSTLYPFDFMLNALQPVQKVSVPQPRSLVEIYNPYIQLFSRRRPVSSSLPGSLRDALADGLALADSLSGEAPVERFPGSPASDAGSDIRPGAAMLSARRRSAAEEFLNLQALQQVEVAEDLHTGLEPIALTSAGVPAIAVAEPDVKENRPGVQSYAIPLELLGGAPSASPRLQSLQISGYKFRSQPYVAVPRTANGFYSAPDWIRLQGVTARDVMAPEGVDRESRALSVLVDSDVASRQLPLQDQAQRPELERLTITVPTVFGTVMHVDVILQDRWIGSL